MCPSSLQNPIWVLFCRGHGPFLCNQGVFGRIALSLQIEALRAEPLIDWGRGVPHTGDPGLTPPQAAFGIWASVSTWAWPDPASPPDLLVSQLKGQKRSQPAPSGSLCFEIAKPQLWCHSELPGSCHPQECQGLRAPQ